MFLFCLMHYKITSNTNSYQKCHSNKKDASKIYEIFVLKVTYFSLKFVGTVSSLISSYAMA